MFTDADDRLLEQERNLNRELDDIGYQTLTLLSRYTDTDNTEAVQRMRNLLEQNRNDAEILFERSRSRIEDRRQQVYDAHQQYLHALENEKRISQRHEGERQ